MNGNPYRNYIKAGTLIHIPIGIPALAGRCVAQHKWDAIVTTRDYKFRVNDIVEDEKFRMWAYWNPISNSHDGIILSKKMRLRFKENFIFCVNNSHENAS